MSDEQIKSELADIARVALNQRNDFPAVGDAPTALTLIIRLANLLLEAISKAEGR